MKLKDVVSLISGGTTIRIYADCECVFYGTMSEVTIINWHLVVGEHLDKNVIRLNASNNTLIIAV